MGWLRTTLAQRPSITIAVRAAKNQLKNSTCRLRIPATRPARELSLLEQAIDRP